MARQRMLHPDFFTDEKIVGCSLLARIFFQGLWCYADRAGRLEDRPVSLKMRILSADNADADDLLEEIESLEPPADLTEAVEELVRATLLLADVSRPAPAQGTRPARTTRPRR
mgnify:CR=1 FL=1